MTASTVATLSVGVALLGVILGVWRDIKGDLTALRSHVDDGLLGVRTELHNVGERVARIEGRLDERDRHVT